MTNPNNIQPATDSKEIVKYAIQKAEAYNLKNSFIRLYGGELAYYVLELSGRLYVGSFTNDFDQEEPNLFQNKKVYNFQNMKIQRIK
jgi:hypothetical protein